MATVDKEIDSAPAKKADAGKEEEEEFPARLSPMCTYLSPKWATKIMTQRACFFGLLVSLQYLLEMCAYISSANFYSDADRLIPCSYTGDLAIPDNASAYFDGPILYLGIFHLMSWIRTALLFCVVFLGINLMQVWYMTIPVTIWGVVAYIIAIMTYFSEDGNECAAAQPFRGQYLLIEICACWFFIIINFLPFFLVCMSKESHDENIRKKEEDEDDEEEDEK